MGPGHSAIAKEPPSNHTSRFTITHNWMPLAFNKLWCQILSESCHVAYHSRQIKIELRHPLISFTSLQRPCTQVGISSPPLMERPTKRARLSPDLAGEEDPILDRVSTPLASLHRSISPPLRARSQSRAVSDALCPDLKSDHLEGLESRPTEYTNAKISYRVIPSPIQLTHIRDLPEQRGYNVDTVKLRDILGDPMIRECWQFNYLFDVDFLMSNFDEDVRSLVKVKVVHGSWERESANRVRVEVSVRPCQCARCT